MRIVRSPMHYRQTVTDIQVPFGLPPIEELPEEFWGYTHMLMGLKEFSDVVYARGSEIDMLIYWGEQNRQIPRGHPYYRFRTGQLRSFMSAAKRMSDLGSRRLTEQKMLMEQRYDAGEVP